MVAINSLHDAERQGQVPMSSVVRSPQVSSEEEVEAEEEEEDEAMHTDDADELDPVDGHPSPPVRAAARSRRRFVKPGQTTFELSFSRRPTTARRAATAPTDAAATMEHVLNDGQEDHRSVPNVSSLSSVLTEVMNGKTKALDNIFDTTPPQPNVTYVVEHAADGTPYVAASDGNKYFANSTIGQIYLKQSTSKASGQETTTSANYSPRKGALNGAEHVAETNLDGKKGPKTLLGFKKFHIGKMRGKKGGTTTLKAVLEQDDRFHGDAKDIATHPHHMNGHSIRDRNKAAQAEAKLLQPLEIRLLDSNGLKSAIQAKSDLLAGSIASSRSSDESMALGSSNGSGSSNSPRLPSPLTQPFPRRRPKHDKPTSAPSLDTSFDEDEDDNVLCRSFQNVRNVDLIRSKSDEMETEPPHVAERIDHEEREYTAEDADDLNASDCAGRGRASSDATNVVEFVGGFKGQLSRRSGASGFMNRKRAVRHARLTEEEQKAADLARKLREACNRVPIEFRDEFISPAVLQAIQDRRRKRARGRRVRFNPDVLCREFEVESEEEDDGYESPDEIVDAVQLVSKYDVVHAEDVVAAYPMENSERYSEDEDEAIVVGTEAPLPPALHVEADLDEMDTVQDDPLTFSQLTNDKRMSYSELY